MQQPVDHLALLLHDRLQVGELLFQALGLLGQLHLLGHAGCAFGLVVLSMAAKKERLEECVLKCAGAQKLCVEVRWHTKNVRKSALAHKTY